MLQTFAGDKSERIKSVKVRFASHVLPGETLETQMWKDGSSRIIFQTRVAERNKVVISNAAVELHEAPPQARL